MPNRYRHAAALAWLRAARANSSIFGLLWLLTHFQFFSGSDEDEVTNRKAEITNRKAQHHRQKHAQREKNGQSNRHVCRVKYQKIKCVPLVVAIHRVMDFPDRWINNSI